MILPPAALVGVQEEEENSGDPEWVPTSSCYGQEGWTGV